MKKFLILGLLLLTIITGAWIFLRDHRNISTRVTTSDFDAFSNASLLNYQGNEVSLETFRGQPLVINSWAVWCPFCRKELPDFAQLQKEFADEVVVIAIDRRESLEKAKSYTDELGITDDMVFLLDPSDSFYKSIGGFSMPETIFVNNKGEIMVHKRGPMELDEMREHTNNLIK